MFEPTPHSLYGDIFPSSIHLDPLAPFITDCGRCRAFPGVTRSAALDAGVWKGRKVTSTD